MSDCCFQKPPIFEKVWKSIADQIGTAIDGACPAILEGASEDRSISPPFNSLAILASSNVRCEPQQQDSETSSIGKSTGPTCKSFAQSPSYVEAWLRWATCWAQIEKKLFSCFDFLWFLFNYQKLSKITWDQTWSKIVGRWSNCKPASARVPTPSQINLPLPSFMSWWVGCFASLYIFWSCAFWSRNTPLCTHLRTLRHLRMCTWWKSEENLRAYWTSEKHKQFNPNEHNIKLHMPPYFVWSYIYSWNICALCNTMFLAILKLALIDSSVRHGQCALAAQRHTGTQKFICGWSTSVSNNENLFMTTQNGHNMS